jgi:hypothetical protein
VKRAHKGELTFGDLFKEYLGRHAKISKRTWEGDEQRYQQYLQKPLGSKKLAIEHLAHEDHPHMPA